MVMYDASGVRRAAGQQAKILNKLVEEWENKDLNSDELAYYVDVQSRVSKKLLEVTQY